MLPRLLVLICLIFKNSCTCQQALTYTAAVVEVNPILGGSVTKPIIDIIKSNELHDVDIVVFPEAILNNKYSPALLPHTDLTYCDDRRIDHVLWSISCAARQAEKYVVIDLYVKVKCEHDDQLFCADKNDNTNLYNMAIVFDRNGDVVAKYRKYHLFGEIGVQQTIKPDLITFKTDFDVTFGVCICFDLKFDEPVNNLIDQGVKNFVYPTMWFNEIPYLTAAQYQQSWAYASNVNLLAANVNSPRMNISGSGIYSGRSGALKVFVSESPETKVLIAKVPIEPLSTEDFLPQVDKATKELCPNSRSLPNPIEELNKNTFSDPYVNMPNYNQDNLTEYTVEFLDFSASLSQSGNVCSNGICCNYNIEVSDNGRAEGKSAYSYAISVFNGLRKYKGIKIIQTGQVVCSLIACTENTKDSCGLRIPLSKAHNRYNFKKLSLETMLPVTNMKIMPNSLTDELLSLGSTEFGFKISKIKEEQKEKYAVKLNLNAPKSNLLTFAIFSRDYYRDITNNNHRETLSSYTR